MELTRRCIDAMQNSPLGMVTACDYTIQVMKNTLAYL